MAAHGGKASFVGNVSARYHYIEALNGVSLLIAAGTVYPKARTCRGVRQPCARFEEPEKRVADENIPKQPVWYSHRCQGPA